MTNCEPATSPTVYFSCPRSLESDHGIHFVNPIIRALCKILRIKHHLYYRQSNGKFERVVGPVKTMLKRAVEEAVEVEQTTVEEGGDNVLGIGTAIDADVIREGEMGRVDVVEDVDEVPTENKKAYWAPFLQSVLWAYRSTPHMATGASPAMLTLGTELRMPFDLKLRCLCLKRTKSIKR